MIGRLIERITARPPDFVIGGADRPYLRRWYEIPRNRFFNVYLHEILRSDDDRALHDHPWFNVSIILQGTYFEHTIRAGGIHRRRLRGAGAVIARAPWTAHRLEVTGRCFTLFLTGPRMRQWGFHCTGGWVHWRSFVNTAGGGGGNPRKS
jgi:hypothetical protein